MRLANLYKFAYVGPFLASVSMFMCQYVLPYTGVRAGPDFGWGVGFWNTHSSVELPIGLFWSVEWRCRLPLSEEWLENWKRFQRRDVWTKISFHRTISWERNKNEGRHWSSPVSRLSFKGNCIIELSVSLDFIRF